MAEYSIADAKNRLPSLIDQAREGERVIITRHGHAVAELMPLERPKPIQHGTYAWLMAQRKKWPKIDINSVELLNSIYEDDA
jgi:prevent-host-death family protein